MDQESIIWRLSRLASLEFQERHVIGGTKDRYFLYTDLFDDVYALKYNALRPDNPVALSEDQLSCLRDLIAFLDEHGDEAFAAENREAAATLMREGKVWIDLRAKASAALAKFGVDRLEASLWE